MKKIMPKEYANILEKIVANVESVIIGKKDVIELALCSFLCGGHILIEDRPGVGKTSLVYALSKSFDCSFKRIQFTPDIMPSDITGFSMYNQKTTEFEYHPGAVMTQILLADEINRTSPKTQSSLLEVMEENQVTVDGKTYEVPRPFVVFATQNPVEYLGTYPLPEAQLDRFFMRISLGYPSQKEESEMLSRFNNSDPLKELKPVTDATTLLEIQEMIKKVHVDTNINDYIITIANSTRINPNILLGASPRASICVYKAAQGMAFYNKRDFVTPDDVKRVIGPVLEHRLSLKQEAKFKKITVAEIISSTLKSVKPPL